MEIISLDTIKKIVPKINLMQKIEEGFKAYSQQKVVVPPVGEMIFDKPPGDVHIKYGYIKGDDIYVIKIASGFYDNPKIHLPTGNGVMLIFSQRTGGLLSILLDEGYLTDIRTAIAGAIAAKYLAPKHVEGIGIVGTGVQARLQLAYLKDIVSCRQVYLFGRCHHKCEEYKSEMEHLGFQITMVEDIPSLLKNANLIVTATAATSPLIYSDHIRPGTHITAVGADTIEKQELDATVFKKVDVLVADSISQCIDRGEIAKAINQNMIEVSQIVEMGDLIMDKTLGRRHDTDISVADLTGVAVQDIQIAKAVYQNVS